MSLLLWFALLSATDAGFTADGGVYRDDSEVVKNLELLELMDETSDFELLEELSAER